MLPEATWAKLPAAITPRALSTATSGATDRRIIGVPPAPLGPAAFAATRVRAVKGDAAVKAVPVLPLALDLAAHVVGQALLSARDGHGPEVRHHRQPHDPCRQQHPQHHTHDGHASSLRARQTGAPAAAAPVLGRGRPPPSRINSDPSTMTYMPIQIPDTMALTKNSTLAVVPPGLYSTSTVYRSCTQPP